jgi:hypothetical protein
MKTVLKTIARIAIILLACLVVVGVTVLLTPASLATGNAEFGPRGARPGAAQTTGQAVDQSSSGASADAQVPAEGQRNFGRPGPDGGEGREGGAMAWAQVGENLLKVSVIVLPFAVVGAISRKRKAMIASA